MGFGWMKSWMAHPETSPSTYSLLQLMLDSSQMRVRWDRRGC